MKPLVTAIITTYQRNENILKRAIDSVINQNYEDLELIIVDDNGIESSYHNMVLNLVKKYSNNKIQLISHRNNEGVQKARNNGIKEAKGEFIALLDDDDEWLENKITEQIKLFQGDLNESVAIVYCWYNLIRIDSSGNRNVQLIKTPEYEQQKVIKELIKTNFIGSNSFPLLRKKYVEKVRLYDESLLSSQDWDLWIRLSNTYEVRCVKEPLVNYYEHKGEKITSNPKARIKGSKIFYSKYKDLIESDTQALSNYSRDLAYYLIKAGSYMEARKLLIITLSADKSINSKKWIYRQLIKSYFLQFRDALKNN